MNLDKYTLNTLRQISSELKKIKQTHEIKNFIEEFDQELVDIEYIRKNYLPWE